MVITDCFHSDQRQKYPTTVSSDFSNCVEETYNMDLENQTKEKDAEDVLPVNADVRGSKEGLIYKLMKSPDRKKYRLTVCLYYAFFTFGWIMGQHGPSFLDFQLITSTGMDKASLFFTASYIGCLVGATGGGILFDRFNRSLLLAVVLLGNSIMTGLLPWCSPYMLMIAVFFVNAVFSGSVDTGLNASLARIWRVDGKSVLQGIHFVYSFGGILSPLVMEPFLALKAHHNDTKELECVPAAEKENVTRTLPNITETDMSSMMYGQSCVFFPYNITYSNHTQVDQWKRETKVQYAYLISAILGISSALPFCIMSCKTRSVRDKKCEADLQKDNYKSPSAKVLIPALTVLGVFYFTVYSVRASFKAFVFTFAVGELGWSNAGGSGLTSCFWASSAFSRLSGIFVVRYLKPITMLLTCCLLNLLSLAGMLFSSIYGIIAGVWISTFGCGLAGGTLFATCVIWTEANLVRVSGKVMAVLVVGESLAGIINPVIIGYLMGEVSNMWFVYLLLIQCSLSLFALTFLWIYTKRVVNRRQETCDMVVASVEDPTVLLEDHDQDFVGTCTTKKRREDERNSF